MFSLIGYALVAVGLARITYELATGKFLDRGWKAYLTRAHNPKLYWLSITVEFLVLVFVTSMVVTNGFKDLSNR